MTTIMSKTKWRIIRNLQHSSLMRLSATQHITILNYTKHKTFNLKLPLEILRAFPQSKALSKYRLHFHPKVRIQVQRDPSELHLE